jgi:Helicase associated domain
VVANARCLGEGVAAIDAVLFAAPKESLIDIVQAVGRALRPHGDAGTATIIVATLLADDDAQPAAAGRWEPVLNVVRALAAHDESLAAELGQARAASAGRPGSRELLGRIIVQAPPGAVARTLEALRIRIIEGTASAWWDGYGHARAYREQNGHLGVPSGHVTASGFPLGRWLSGQRNARNRGRLPAGRAALLDSLGITWDQADAAWQRAYADLRAFRDEHGHCEVPPGRRTCDGAGLAAWAHKQREAGRAGAVTARRKALLDQIDFPWDPAEARWMRRYRQLAQAIARHGSHRDLPPGSPEAAWLKNQYSNNFRDGKLTDRQAALLEEAGVRFRPRAGRVKWPCCCFQARASA